MIYFLHPAAEQDLATAVRFYHREAGRSVAARLIDEFERVAALLADDPGLGTPTSVNRRTFPLHGFPYSVIYRPVDGGIRILVVRHQHRSPGFGTRRR
ncbi:type II toxin-antitoxin system RelE/ParE family toxin [Thiohalocapsa marina]|uniref:type II toxin-antitoxin system RelE/ParE family toxin n=1 Tax=Thiohalocapsa marina TaxID=424902 RepID=UPI0036DE21DD